MVQAVVEQVAWSRNAEQYRALLSEIVALGHDVDRAAPLPGLGTSSRLIDLAPADTVILAALPNATATLAEGYRLLKQRLASSPAPYPSFPKRG